MQAIRVGDGPIISPATHSSIGQNIQGPSLVRVPPWVADPLGRYYLYFADHKGSYIRMAYADEVTGPWTVHEPGALHLVESCFLTEPPPATDEELEFLRAVYADALGTDQMAESLAADATTPHIASPDVHVDTGHHCFVMYFHGLDSLGVQNTRVARSANGLNFKAQPEVLGASYFRAFRYDGYTYAVTMPGQISRSVDGLTGFEAGPTRFDKSMRHSALLRDGDTLNVFWTRVGDAPESILLSTIDLRGDWMGWTETDAAVLLRPEHDWEGADAPTVPSIRSVAHGHVNQLRDPCVFVDEGQRYLLYAVAGESGIALAELTSD